MKKTILLAIAAILFANFARAIESEYSYYGLSANFNLHIVDNGEGFSMVDEEVMPMVGIDLGFYMQQQLYKNFVLVSGLKYQVTTDWEYKQTSIGKYKLEECNMFLWNHAFVIPVKLGYSMHLPHNWMISFYAGPSLSFNFATTQKFKDNEGNYIKYDYVNGSMKTNILEDEKDADNLKVLKWFDVPFGLGITAKHKYVGIKLEYECGLIDRYNGEYTGKFSKSQWHSHQISLGAVFTF